MMSSRRDRKRAKRSRSNFEAAKAACRPDQMLCGTVADDGRPLYFVMPREASDDEIELRSFEVKHGRPLQEGERILRDAVKVKQAR